MAVIMSIVERGSGNKLMKLYTQNLVFTHIRCEGTGTATSEIMDILGLGSSEKDIIFSFAPVSAARSLLDRLDDELHGAFTGRGIAFTMRLTAVNNLIASYISLRTAMQAKQDKDTGGSDSMETQQKNSLILVTVNQGYTDIVMDTARKAGARGGTIIRARWSFAQARGLTHLQAEKEMIFIVVPRELRNGVMEAVNKQHGLQSEAGAMVSAIAIEQLVHLS